MENKKCQTGRKLSEQEVNQIRMLGRSATPREENEVIEDPVQKDKIDNEEIESDIKRAIEIHDAAKYAPHQIIIKDRPQFNGSKLEVNSIWDEPTIKHFIDW